MELRQFLGLTGYYIGITITTMLTGHLPCSARASPAYGWTKLRVPSQNYNKMPPKTTILTFPDQDKCYVLFTDTPKYCFSAL